MQDVAEAIRPIFHHHNLPNPNFIKPLPGGMVNAVFDVDHAYIIRFNQRDSRLLKFAREAHAYGYLQGHVPVPTLIAYSNDRQYADCEYIILERLAGTTLKNAWEKMSIAECEAAAFEAGAILARMHDVAIGVGFGRMEDRRYKSWRDYIESYAQRNIAKAQELGILATSDIGRIERLVADAAWLETISQPALVHSDYYFGNIHYHAKKIVGVYDFEWATAGDPALDLKDTMYLEQYNVGAEQPFIAGYESIRPIPYSFEQRSIFYQILYEVELVPVAFQYWGKQRFKETKENLQRLFAVI